MSCICTFPFFSLISQQCTSLSITGLVTKKKGLVTKIISLGFHEVFIIEFAPPPPKNMDSAIECTIHYIPNFISQKSIVIYTN